MMRLSLAIGLACSMVSLSTVLADDLARSTWQIPTHPEVESRISDWLEEADFDAAIADQIRQQWSKPVPADQRLDVLSQSFELLGADMAKLMQDTRTSRFSKTLPDLGFLQDVPEGFLTHHVKLIYARWLVQNELYNETLDQLQATTVEDVIDPAAMLFYQSIAHHRLLDKDACLPLVNRLLEREEDLPRRFAILARLIREDIEPLEPDSLDEISRLMDNIKVRLGHGRAGKRVRTEEDDVIAKLDKMIKKLEEQAQSSSSSSQSQGGQPSDSLNPAAPMEDSMPGGGRGPGNVDAKDVGNQKGWGNLPPKERQQALQQVGKDFPSHYRDVIEEYFRKLAKDGADAP